MTILIANHLNDYVFAFMDILCLEKWTMYSKYLTPEIVYGTNGIHPIYSHQYDLTVELNLRKALSNKRIFTFREIGIDLTR
jgi:hypothetical protein